MPAGNPPRERPRLLVVGVRWPLQTFLSRLFDGLVEPFEVMVACRSAFDDPRFRRIALPPESWPRPLRAAQAGLSAAAALGHPAGRRLARAGAWRSLPYLRAGADVIYFPWNFGATANLPLMRLGLPTVISCRGTQVQVAPHRPDRRTQTARLRESFELATRVHCVSRAMLGSACELGLDVAKARVIRPAVDPTFFRPARATQPPPGPPFRLVAVGSLVHARARELGIGTELPF